MYINHCLPEVKGVFSFFYDSWLAIIGDGTFGDRRTGPSGKFLLLAGGVLKGVQILGLLVGILNFIPTFLGRGVLLFGWMKL